MIQEPIREKYKKYYYHISSKNMGEYVIMKPRDYGELRAYNEPSIRRICVGPNVANCFSAVPISNSKYNVYRTEEKVYAYKPFGVKDASWTGERWLIDNTDFIKISEIPRSVVSLIYQLTDGNDCDCKKMQIEMQKMIDMIMDKNGNLSLKCHRDGRSNIRLGDL